MYLRYNRAFRAWPWVGCISAYPVTPGASRVGWTLPGSHETLDRYIFPKNGCGPKLEFKAMDLKIAHHLLGCFSVWVVFGSFEAMPGVAFPPVLGIDFFWTFSSQLGVASENLQECSNIYIHRVDFFQAERICVMTSEAMKLHAEFDLDLLENCVFWWRFLISVCHLMTCWWMSSEFFLCVSSDFL